MSCSLRILIIFGPVLPSPNGFVHAFFLAQLIFAASRILSGSVPARMFEPTPRFQVSPYYPSM